MVLSNLKRFVDRSHRLIIRGYPYQLITQKICVIHVHWTHTVLFNMTIMITMTIMISSLKMSVNLLNFYLLRCEQNWYYNTNDECQITWYIYSKKQWFKNYSQFSSEQRIDWTAKQCSFWIQWPYSAEILWLYFS